MENNQEESKIVINGVEYDPEEAQNLIDYGKRTVEAEEKYNTKFDKVWPEYNRSQERLKQLETELEEARKQRTDTPAQNNDANQNTVQDGSELSESQKQAARRLGVVFREDLDKNGYLTKDTFQELFQQQQTAYQKEQENIRRVLKEADDLENNINGSDGRPKFRKDLVMAYASAYGIGDLTEAYEKMYSDDLKGWKEAQVEASKKPSLKTLRGGGSKTPPEIRVNRDNLRDLIHESITNPDE